MEAVNDDGRYLETHEGELYKGKTVCGWPGPARTRDISPPPVQRNRTRPRANQTSLQRRPLRIRGLVLSG